MRSARCRHDRDGLRRSPPLRRSARPEQRAIERDDCMVPGADGCVVYVVVFCFASGWKRKSIFRRTSHLAEWRADVGNVAHGQLKTSSAWRRRAQQQVPGT